MAVERLRALVAAAGRRGDEGKVKARLKYTAGGGGTREERGLLKGG